MLARDIERDRSDIHLRYKAIVNDILVSAPPPASEITPARILSLLSHYFSFLNILSLFNKGVVILSLYVILVL